MVRTNNRKQSTHAIVYINYATIALLIYLIYRYKLTIFSIGGSSLFLVLSIIIITLTYIIKPLAFEISMSILPITAIFFFNFISYLEVQGEGIDRSFWALSFLSLFYYIITYTSILRAPFKKYDEIIESDRPLFLKILLTILLPIYIIGLVFGMFSSIIVYDIQISEPLLVNSYPVFKLSYNAVAWLILSLIVTLICLSNIKDQDIRKFFIESKLSVIQYDRDKLKKYYSLILLCIIILGSFLEIQRGMWIMWVESILLVSIMSMILWKIYKHVFQ